MKFGLCVAILLATLASATAQTGSSQRGNSAGAIEACLARCTSTDTSCRQVCPITFNVPCLSSCDNQTRFCRQACQNR